MGNKTFVYTGCDNLEAMTEAVNYNKFLIGQVISQLNRFKTPAILDFGAGSGTYADMLKDQGIMVDCLEPDQKLKKILKSKKYKIYSDVKELKPKTYDVIYALNVMEHIEDDFSVFSQLTKALKKNGIIIIYVPAFKVLWSPMDNLVGHYRRYRKSRLHKMANDSKLEVVKLKYCDPLGFAAAVAYKATKPKTGTISPRAVKIYDRTAFPLSRLIEPLSSKVFGKNVVLVAKKSE